MRRRRALRLVFAFAYNIIGIPIAAGVLYPAFGLLLSPIIAAAAMSFSSVSVIANALRCERPSFRAEPQSGLAQVLDESGEHDVVCGLPVRAVFASDRHHRVTMHLG
jgi:hypothetical protein